jgi:ribosomal protein S12 methylthiotransferase accessory factor
MCGVTRLADVTGLDRLGLPVFQAVRPMGRALSVHQGKGLCVREAKVGALMEAIESDHAETFDGETRVCAWRDLPADERAGTLSDFARDRRFAPALDEPLAWVRAERLTDGGTRWAPFDVVSLDFTRRGDMRLDRSSNGLGAGFDRDAATLTALLEVIERDALQVWRAASPLRRSNDRVALETIPFGWFQGLLARIRTVGLTLAVYQLPTLVGLPLFVCELVEPAANRIDRGRFCGSACRPDLEDALQRSVAEAAQARLTAISGVRDDILPTARVEDGGLRLGLPLSPRMRPRPWREIEAGHAGPPVSGTRALARRLAATGYGDAALVDLTRPSGTVFVVKVVVPGLAAGARSRRPPDIAT